MTVQVQCFGVSLDGFGAGPRQDLQNPLGVGGPANVEWFCATRAFRRMHGGQGGETGVGGSKYRAGLVALLDRA